MISSLPKTLAFRYVFASSVVKENVVTLFGEIGSEYQKGTDYDAAITYYVSSAELSNLVNYYNGGILNGQVVLPNGTIGSADMTSMLSVNAEVKSTSIFPFNNGYKITPGGAQDPHTLTDQDSGNAGGQYYLGDIVLFDPANPGASDSANASCWTCVRATSSINDPIPLRGSVPRSRIDRDAPVGSTAGFAGFFGSDKNSQNYITGVAPAYYSPNLDDPLRVLVLRSEYWRESAIARSYDARTSYYAGQIIVYSGGLYECISTQGDAISPALYLNTAPTTAAQSILPPSIADAPNGSYGFDFLGQRYIMGVPPSGSVFSGNFWKPTTARKFPTSTFVNLNWLNTEVRNKINTYDSNITGGNGAQTIPSFLDDASASIVTLRKIYDDNEKGFVLDVATNILNRIPAAAIKGQQIGQRPAPDSTLAEMVMAAPRTTSPEKYSPAVQGVFEEAVYSDMLQVSGVPTTIAEFVVSNGSEGYYQDGSTGAINVRIVEKIGGTSVLASNPTFVSRSVNNRMVARVGINRVEVNKASQAWHDDTTTYAVGDVIEVNSSGFTTPAVETQAMFFISAVLKVLGVSPEGKLLSVAVENPGDGYLGLPPLGHKGEEKSFLIPRMKIVGVQAVNDPLDTANNSWSFAADEFVNVSFGSGSGAVGMARVTTGPVPRPTNIYATDLAVTFDTGVTGVSRGTGYVVTPYKQDIVQLKGSSSGARIPAQVTSINTDGGIQSVKLLQQGCGYLKAPYVQLVPPPKNPLDRATAADALSGATSGVTISDPGLLGIDNSGRYALTPDTSGFTPLPYAYSSTVSGTSGAITPYLGITYVDIIYGGSGFQTGEKLTVAGTVRPAVVKAAAGSSGPTALFPGGFDVSIVDGGRGYESGQYLVLDGPTAGVNLLGRVTKLGGNVTSLSFLSSALVGVSYAKGDEIDLSFAIHAGDGVTGDTLRATVTSVEASGQLFDDAQLTGGATSEKYSNGPTAYVTVDSVGGYTGETFTVGTLLNAIPVYKTIVGITPLRSGTVYTGVNPNIIISEPDGAPRGTAFVPIPATASAVMGLSALGVTGPAGSGFRNGDFVRMSQDTVNGELEARAVVLQTTTTGAVRALGVEAAGLGFDISQPFTFTTNGDGQAASGATSGTSFDEMFTPYMTVVGIDVTEGGLGYDSQPTVTIENAPGGSSTGVSQSVTVNLQKAGSGGLFRIVSVDQGTGGLDAFETKLLSRGIGYTPGDLLDFYGPISEETDFVRQHGLLALVDETVGGNILAARVVPGSAGTLYKLGNYSLPLSTASKSPPGYDPVSNPYTLNFRVTAVGDTTAITGLEVTETVGDVSENDVFTHKEAAVVEVGEVDSNGKIISLVYKKGGYGYVGMPVVKASPESTGVGSLFSVPYLGVTRIENGYDSNTSYDIESVYVSGPPAAKAATVYATIPGDLHPISVDLFKNPTLLDTLERIKPGSTTGYAQGKAIMRVNSIAVVHSGLSLGNLLSATPGQPGLTINVSAPDLSASEGGIQAVARVDSNGWNQQFQYIMAVTMVSQGAGYLKPPVVTVTLADGAISDNMPILKAQMAVNGVKVTSRGIGFDTPPGAMFSDSDVTPGLRATVTSTTLKKTITNFNVEAAGAQYLEVPSVRVIGPGTGAIDYVRMAISDVGIVDGGAGFVVGDILEFSHFGVTGTTLLTRNNASLIGLTNSAPPSDLISNAGIAGTNYFPTTCVQACVASIDETTGAIETVVINQLPYTGATGKYGEFIKARGKNSIEFGGLGYGMATYTDPLDSTVWKTETLPRVTGFWRPDEFGAEPYFSPGVTLSSGSSPPWYNNNGTIKTDATFTDGNGADVPILYELAINNSITELAALRAAKAVHLPSIDVRMAVRRYGLFDDRLGTKFVSDAQVLIDSPPSSQQARFNAVVDKNTKAVTGFIKQSGGSGYTVPPKVSVEGGGGVGAGASPIMGIGEVKIIDGGKGYAVGDIVQFPTPTSGEPASGVVTVIDGGSVGTGQKSEIQLSGTSTSIVGFDNATKLPNGGEVQSGEPVTLVLEGYGYKVGDTVTFGDRFKGVNPTMTNYLIAYDGGQVDTASTAPVSEQWDKVYFRTFLYTDMMWRVGDIISVTLKYSNGNVLTTIYAQVNTVLTQYGQVSLYSQNGDLLNSQGMASHLGYLATGIFWGYGYDNVGYPGYDGLAYPQLRFLGETATTPTSFADFHFIASGQAGGTLEFNYIPVGTAKFTVLAINDQQNGVLGDVGAPAPVELISDEGGSLFPPYYVSTLESGSRGAISYVNVLEPGSHYTSVPDSSEIVVTNLDGSASNGTGAVFYPSLTLNSLTLASGGSLYFGTPTVYIDAPLFRALTPQLYARSAEIPYQDGSFFDHLAADTAGVVEVTVQGTGYIAGGIYQLVIFDDTYGGLHQKGNASFSVDSLIILGGTQCLVDPNDIKSGPADSDTRYNVLSSNVANTANPTNTLLQDSEYIVRGSNYRVNELYKLMPYGSTPALGASGVVASIKIKKVTSVINNAPQTYRSGNNDGAGILDEGRLINGSDVGGYGAGYVTIPKSRVVGGSQGVTVTPSMGLIGVDFVKGARGAGYSVGDQVWAQAPEFGSAQVGTVTKVEPNGAIANIQLFTPYKAGLRSNPIITAVRQSVFDGVQSEAGFVPVLGIADASITSNTDGFIGSAFIEVDSPAGSGYTVQPDTAVIAPNYVFMVDQVFVDPTGGSGSSVLYSEAPVVKFDTPPFIHTFSGWNGVYFAPGDAFEIVVQYTVAKAVAFEVDADVTLPGKYSQADSITIGGITIPLRKPGTNSSQGRELSANRIVYKYLVKMVAV
jgi:hypothetical protein